MAQKTIVTLTDDLSGEEADETVRFGLDGAQYEIDLGEENATKLREALAPFVTAARRSTGHTVKGGQKGRRTTSSDHTANVREWALANGYTVSDRGRISGTILEAYQMATAAR